jgi:hypothetical protein
MWNQLPIPKKCHDSNVIYKFVKDINTLHSQHLNVKLPPQFKWKIINPHNTQDLKTVVNFLNENYIKTIVFTNDFIFNVLTKNNGNKPIYAIFFENQMVAFCHCYYINLNIMSNVLYWSILCIHKDFRKKFNLVKHVLYNNSLIHKDCPGIYSRDILHDSIQSFSSVNVYIKYDKGLYIDYKTVLLPSQEKHELQILNMLNNNNKKVHRTFTLNEFNHLLNVVDFYVIEENNIVVDCIGVYNNFQKLNNQLDKMLIIFHFTNPKLVPILWNNLENYKCIIGNDSCLVDYGFQKINRMNYYTFNLYIPPFSESDDGLRFII